MDLKNRLIIALFVFQFGSCAFIPERSFYEQMQGDEFHVMSPRQHFRVVSGDQNSGFDDKESFKRRVPATTSETMNRNYHLSLETELEQLLQSQTEESLTHYERYQSYLPSISEKIYFLRLPSTRDRDEYLYSKGLYQSVYHTRPEYQEAQQRSELLPGMTKKQILKSFGHPLRRDIAGNPALENERWVYRMENGTKLIFFEGGKVEGWTSN